MHRVKVNIARLPITIKAQLGLIIDGDISWKNEGHYTLVSNAEKTAFIVKELNAEFSEWNDEEKCYIQLEKQGDMCFRVVEFFRVSKYRLKQADGYAEKILKKVLEGLESSEDSEHFTFFLQSPFFRKSVKTIIQKLAQKSKNGPKKPKNSFLHFCDSKRKETMAKYPTLSLFKLTPILAEKWRALSEEEKKPFIFLSRQESEKYKKELRRLKGPKRPISAYLFFCKDNREKIKEENPNFFNCDLYRELGKLWREQKDRVKWEKMSETDKERYRKEKNDLIF